MLVSIRLPERASKGRQVQDNFDVSSEGLNHTADLNSSKRYLEGVKGNSTK